MPTTVPFFLCLTVVLFCVTGAHAFGAGNDIPAFSYVSGKAFRHGDIESILENLAKSAGGAAGGGIIGHILRGGRGPSFTKADVKRVYFGNWLRDYSQAMDIAGLSKLSSDTLILILSVLGFMTFGFSTREFNLTADRLGVYLPVEHIDNPKGYAEKEGDARQFHPKLRPPVQSRELEIDQRNGMKKYIATENEGFDTSSAHVRRIFRECIERGRRAGGRENEDQWEAFRLLGTGLHTLEDFPAHSNFTELVLCKMGHEVFCHVGDNVRINTPNGRAAPIVTGTFGSADFLHSLLGEATDKISQSSVTDLASHVNNASQNSDNNISSLISLLKQIPSGGGDKKTGQAEEMQSKSKAYHFDPDQILPPEARASIKDVLVWHDDVMRDIEETLSRIPGLEDLIENLTNALNAYIYTVIAPYIAPALAEVTGVLSESSKAVIESDDQYAVFDNANASDPSHSMLSKDHFNLILNEPCGLVAQTIVEHSVNLIVQAWSDNSDPDQVIDQILKALHHPYLADGSSEIQNAMRETVEKWFAAQGSESREIIEKLSKEGVREHRNVRKGSEGSSGGHGHGGSGAYGSAVHGSGGYPSSGHPSGVHGSGGYGSGAQSSGVYGSTYGRQTDSYGTSQGNTYSSGGRDEYGSNRNTYGQSDSYGGRTQSSAYGGSQREHDSYGSREERSYGQSESYGQRQDKPYGQTESYGQRQDKPYGQSESYGQRQEKTYGQSGSYGQHQEKPYGQSESYGQRQDKPYGQSESYGQRQEKSYGQSGSYGQRQDKPYGQSESYGQREERSYGSHGERSYGQSESYGGHRENPHEQSESYGSSRLPQSTYGQSDTYGRTQSSYESERHERQNPERSSYNARQSHGKSGSDDDNDHGKHQRRHKDDDDDDDDNRRRGQKGSYGKSRDSDDDDDNRGHGHKGNYGKSRDSDDDSDSKRRRHRERRSSSHESNEYASGYKPSYARRSGDDDTYGAERLKISEDKHGHRQRKYDD